MKPKEFEIFIACLPGLEHELLSEIKKNGFKKTKLMVGGVSLFGDWCDVWRANFYLRGATKVLVRFASFRTTHLAQLDKLSHKLNWESLLQYKKSFRVETVCRKSKIYHSGAASQRISKAISDKIDAKEDSNSDIIIKARISSDICTISLDSSGKGLHKRGYKIATGKAPIRETLAALFLQKMKFDGSQVVYDPMCGSGTIIIEAAEIALGLPAGRNRTFAFMELPSFQKDEYEKLTKIKPKKVNLKFYGSDRDNGAIQNSIKNSKNANVETSCQFETRSISGAIPPTQEPGIVLVNPPYGKRVGNRKNLFALYRSLGQTLKKKFVGWQVGIITSDPGLAKATELKFLKISSAVDNGGIKVQLYETKINHPQI
ncbi:MAG: class I SAM-dependent RNA methyltransferase [Paracoccaceae bacterium]